MTQSKTVQRLLMMSVAISCLTTNSALAQSSGAANSPAAPLDTTAGASADATFTRVSQVGDVVSVTTPNASRLHVYGGIAFETGDYTRGAFDDVREGKFDDGEVVLGLDGGIALELIDERIGVLENLSFSAGSGNGFSDSPVATIGDEFWYESNNYIGLSAGLAGGFVAGVSYYSFNSPDVPGPEAVEIAAALRYEGDDFIGGLAPQIKIAKRTEVGEGIFAQATVTPSFDVAEIEAGAVSLSFPLVFSAGFNDYYGAGTDTSYYGAIGSNLSVPLDLPSRYGAWAFDAGVTLIVRDDDIAQAGRPVDNADNTVVLGNVGLSFVY